MILFQCKNSIPFTGCKYEPRPNLQQHATPTCHNQYLATNTFLRNQSLEKFQVKVDFSRQKPQGKKEYFSQKCYSSKLTTLIFCNELYVKLFTIPELQICLYITVNTID